MSVVLAGVLISPVLAAAFWDGWFGLQGPVKAASRQATATPDDGLLLYGSDGDLLAYADVAADLEIWRQSITIRPQVSDSGATVGQGTQYVSRRTSQASRYRWLGPKRPYIMVSTSAPSYFSLVASASEGDVPLCQTVPLLRSEAREFGISRPSLVDTSESANTAFRDGAHPSVAEFQPIQINGQTSSVPEASTMLAAGALLAPAGMFLRKRRT